jgi:transglutaminase-like putative cysteine protease
MGFMAIVALVPPAVSAAEESPYTIKRHIRYGYEVQNRTASVVTNVALWIYAPLEQTSSQLCVDLATSVAHEMQTDDLGNRILRFQFASLPPYATRQVIVEANVLMAEQPGPLSDRGSAWLRAEPLLEWNAPAFQEAGPRIPQLSGQATAKHVYDWVADSVRDEGYVKEDRGALYALQKKTGDCTEFACLFAALCRREHIPARVLAGYVCTRNRNLGPLGYHNWAEYHVEGTWRVADPQRRRFNKKPSEYVALRVLGTSNNGLRGNPRYRVQGEGISASMMTWRKP